MCTVVYWVVVTTSVESRASDVGIEEEFAAIEVLEATGGDTVCLTLLTAVDVRLAKVELANPPVGRMLPEFWPGKLKPGMAPPLCVATPVGDDEREMNVDVARGALVTSSVGE